MAVAQIRKPAPLRLVFDGQSMNILPFPRHIPHFATHGTGIPYLLTGYPGWGWTNLTASQKLRLSTQPRNRDGCVDILIMNGGQSDILGDYAADAEEAYGIALTYAATARSYGWQNIIICTWPDIDPESSNCSDAKRAEFLVYNQYVRDHWENDFEGIADLAVPFTDFSDLSVYSTDGVHLNEHGAKIGGAIMREAILDLYNSIT